MWSMRRRIPIVVGGVLLLFVVGRVAFAGSGGGDVAIDTSGASDSQQLATDGRVSQLSPSGGESGNSHAPARQPALWSSPSPSAQPKASPVVATQTAATATPEQKGSPTATPSPTPTREGTATPTTEPKASPTQATSPPSTPAREISAGGNGSHSFLAETRPNPLAGSRRNPFAGPEQRASDSN